MPENLYFIFESNGLLLYYMFYRGSSCVVMSDGEEMKKRMYSCILVVGGGLMFAGAYSWLQHRVWINMPPQARIGLEVMDVITRPKVMHHCQAFYQENYFCFFLSVMFFTRCTVVQDIIASS